LFRAAQEIVSAEVSGRTAVVIDVLRATTTISTALAAGCERVLPTRSPEEARARRAELPPGSVVLGGERGGVRIEGFDLDNSPLSYTTATVGGKTLIITTTNGTEAMGRAAGAAELVAASFLNVDAVQRWLSANADGIVICCAGEQGAPSQEDELCAGLLIDRLRAAGADLELNPAAAAALESWRAVTDLRAALRRAEHGQVLAGLGFAADVDFAARLDSITTVPRRHDGWLVPAAAIR
jgi:2-phosphosulfolactate phosphatase